MKRFLITFLLLLLIAAGAFAGFCYWAGNREPFAVLYDGISLDVFDETLSVSVSEPLIFEVQGNDDYFVKIVPCESAKVLYEVRDYKVSLADLDDFSESFEITYGDHSVTIAPKGSLERILSLYHGVSVSLPEDVDMNQDLFTLVISNGKQEYRADFGLIHYVVNGIELLPDKVVF